MGSMRRIFLHQRATAVMLAAGLALQPVWAATQAAAAEMVTLDFRNVEIAEFVKTVSKITGRNFLIDQGIRGTVTILGPTAVPISEVWRIFHSVLEVKGLAVTRVGSLYKIIQRREIKNANAPVLIGRASPGISDEPVIQIVPLEYGSAEDAVNFLKNFVGKNGQVFSHGPTNTLVMIDEAVNIDKMLRLLKEIDSPRQEEKIEFIALEHLAAKEAIEMLNGIMQSNATDAKTRRRISRRGGGSQAAADAGLRMVADERLNRVIMIGPADEVAAAKELLNELDKPVPLGNDLIRVYPLQYGDAEEMAATLNTLLTGEATVKAAAGAKDAAATKGRVQVVADKPNNALIFVADQADYLRALSVLRKLDVPRPQVYVEAAIVEVFLNNQGDWSITGGFARDQQIMGEDGYVFGGEAIGGLSPLGLNLASLATLNGLFAGAIVTPQAGNLPPLGAILRAIRTNDNVNVLSTPHLLTSDNEEAEIVVGDNVPFLTGQTATSGGNVISSIDRRDVGITMRVTPTINDANQVRLQIYQEISSVSAQAPSGLDVNQQGLITRKRSAKTNVFVANGQTVAIGGLISEEDSNSESKVPVLGDIPIIGWLFKAKKVQRRRTNLVIFLTPHILRNAAEASMRTRHVAERFEDRSGKFVSEGQEIWFDDFYAGSPTDAAEAERMFMRSLLVETTAPAAAAGQATIGGSEPTTPATAREPSAPATTAPSSSAPATAAVLGEPEVEALPPTRSPLAADEPVVEATPIEGAEPPTHETTPVERDLPGDAEAAPVDEAASTAPTP